MLFSKKVSATVLSKSVEIVENPPDMGRANPMLEALALQDKNKALWFHDTFYNVTFVVGENKKQFKTDEYNYKRLNEGDAGILVYSGSNFISFTKE